MNLTQILIVLGLLAVGGQSLTASEGPFFVTYTSQLEEQGNLEISSKALYGHPGVGNPFLGAALEFEYGIAGWWTMEAYLDGQVTSNDSALFSGYRWENRFRLTQRQHWINPVFYVELENINGADKSLLEVVGHDSEADLAGESNAATRSVKKREVETKLILSSYWRGWNLSENLIFEKNVAHQPWEFGYAIGVYRPLALEARPDPCRICAENFRVGVESYGGLGDTWSLKLQDTSHYVAPVVEWQLPNGPSFKVSPGFGVTQTSAPFLLRFGVSYEIPQFGRWLIGRR